MTPPPPAPLSETWTEQDETLLQEHHPYGSTFLGKLAREIHRLRAENERLRHASVGRWNIEEDDETRVLLVCKNNHARSEGCHFEEYVPRSEFLLQREEIERLRGAVFDADSRTEAERLKRVAAEEASTNGAVRLHEVFQELRAARSELSSLRETPDVELYALQNAIDMASGCGARGTVASLQSLRARLTRSPANV